MPFGMDGNCDLSALHGLLGGQFGGLGGQGTNPLSPATGNGRNIRPNMNPAQNSWSGDQFNIGKPQVNGGTSPSVPGTIPPGGAGGAPVDPNGMFAQQGGGAPTNLLPGPAPAPKPEVNAGPRTGAEGNPFQMGMMGMNMMQNAQRPQMQAADLQPMQRPQMAPPQMPQNMMPNAMRARMTQTGAGNPFMRQEQY